MVEYLVGQYLQFAASNGGEMICFCALFWKALLAAFLLAFYSAYPLSNLADHQEARF